MFVLNIKPDLNKKESILVYSELAFLLKCMSEYFGQHPELLAYGTRVGWRSLELTLNQVADHILTLGGELPVVEVHISGLKLDASYIPDNSGKIEESEVMQLVKTICKSMMFMCREFNSGSRKEILFISYHGAIRKVFRRWQQDCINEMRRLRGQAPLFRKLRRGKHKVTPVTMYS